VRSIRLLRKESAWTAAGFTGENARWVKTIRPPNVRIDTNKSDLRGQAYNSGRTT
jgi:hypothetical protein